VTVREVLQEIEDNSEFIFLYSEKSVDLNRKVTISANNKNVDFVLNQVFEGTDNYFEIHDRQIAIMSKKDKLPAESIKNKTKPSVLPQKKTINGKVTDESGEYLPGANIVEKGTRNGTTTNIDGEFSIDVSGPDAVLLVSFIGYINQEVAINGRTSVVIKLEKKENQLMEVITTGTNRTSMTVLETSYATSIMTPKDIDRESAGMGIIDMMKGVPGLYGQPSGGEVGSSLSPRGLSSNFFTYISLQEDGLPVQYGGTYSEMQLKNDLTFDRVEVIRGGPSGIFAVNGSGAIINFISRMPEGDPTGRARLSVTSYGTTKGEFVYGGKLAENWYGTIGGSYREGRGIKPRGFTNQQGGQLRAKLKRKIEGGAITLSFKLLDDATPLYHTAPTKMDAAGKLSPIPGYDSQTQALAGPQTRHAYMTDETRWSRKHDDGFPFDLADGIHAKSIQYTLKFEKDLNENISISNHSRVSRLSHIQTDLRNGGGNLSIQKVSDHIANNQENYLAAIGGGATGIELRNLVDGKVLNDNINGNGLVTPYKLLMDGADRNVVMNDFKLSLKFGGHHITLGNLYFNTTHKSRGAEQSMLIDVKENANVIDIVGLDAAGNAVGSYNPNGIMPGSMYSVVGNSEIQSISYILNDEYQVTDNLKIDAGIRYEKINYTLEGITFAGSNNYQQRTFNDVAWTIGGNYKLG
ncbi:MAG: carboxypeptidase-like regulatory domain-containing protein, partial [Draconibacterium sp.]|nr:carboxypeptidase-like regulatory domain-containing protein [Draconibacterium sp.]